MNRRTRFALFAAVALLILLAGGAIFGYRLVRSSLPVTEGVVAVPGTFAPVKVYRDEYGVPHIVAQDQDDLGFATGYVQAQDRLWQMDFLRRVVQGRLSEVFGGVTLDADKALRVIGFSRTAKALKDSLDPESGRFIEAYTRGVNAFIDQHRDNLPIEFTLLGFYPEPWQVEHSLAISRLLGWQLSMGWYLDVMMSQIADTVGVAKWRELVHRYPAGSPTVTTSSELRNMGTSLNGEKSASALSSKTPAVLKDWALAMTSVSELMAAEPWAVGSNNWVIAPSRTRDGSAILANDPHLGHGLPSTWYEMHLVGGNFDVIGYALPGLPYVVIGNTRDVAWGFTNVMTDETDFYRERIRDSLYLYDGRWLPMKRNLETIVVKDSSSVTLDIPETHHGPLVNAMYRGLDSEDAIAVNWLGHRITREGSAIHRLNTAKSVEDLRAAARLFSVPAQNMVFIDGKGNIGYQFFGSTPVRTGDGSLILDGTTSYNDWRGILPFEERPYVLNPDKGFIASANNKVVDDAYPYFLSNYFYEPARIERIVEVLAGNNKFTVEDCKSLQNDLKNRLAPKIIPIILAACREDSTVSLQDPMLPPSNVYQEALLVLKHWDGESGLQSRGATVFHGFWTVLLTALYEDELGEVLCQSFSRSYLSVPATVQLIQSPGSDWWDNRRTTDVVERRDDIIQNAFRDGVDYLVKRLGSEPGSWTWERLHTITFEHPLGKQPPLHHLFNVGPFSHGGDGQTPNKATFRYTGNDYKTFEGASMRRIISSKDLGEAWSVITLGQSGQPFSGHFRDQVDLWLKGHYRKTSMNMDDWKTYRLLELNPVGR